MAKPDPLSKEELARQYGFAWALIKGNKTLVDLFTRAVDEKWDDAKFDVELRGTSWWENSADPWRQAWIAEHGTDKTWERVTLPTAMESVKDAAAAVGVTLSVDEASRLARLKLYGGWDDDQVTSILVRGIDSAQIRGLSTKGLKDLDGVEGAGTLQGTAAATEEGLRKFIADNGLSDASYDDAWIRTMTARILDPNDQMDKASVYNKVLERAKTRYPSIADQLLFSDQGAVTVKSAMSPYVEMLKSTWGVGDVDVNDPILKRALQFQDAKGQFTLKSLYEVEREARQDDRFKNSTAGRQLYAHAADLIAQRFGLVG